MTLKELNELFGSSAEQPEPDTDEGILAWFNDDGFEMASMLYELQHG